MTKTKNIIAAGIAIASIGIAGYTQGVPSTGGGTTLQTVRVVHIADGDTIAIQKGRSKAQTVRLIGVDTPEKYKVKIPECYALEASAFTTRTLSGQIVQLQSYGVDTYGRILGVLTTSGGIVYNEELLRQGYATPWVSFANIAPEMKEKYKKLGA